MLAINSGSEPFSQKSLHKMPGGTGRASSPPRLGSGAGQHALQEFLASRQNIPPQSQPAIVNKSSSGRETLPQIADKWNASGPAHPEGQSLWQRWLREARASAPQPANQETAIDHSVSASVSLKQQHDLMRANVMLGGALEGTMPERMDAVVMKKRTEPGGIFGVGLQLSADIPHVVQRVSRAEEQGIQKFMSFPWSHARGKARFPDISPFF
jgi:hypothetical protein